MKDSVLRPNYFIGPWPWIALVSLCLTLLWLTGAFDSLGSEAPGALIEKASYKTSLIVEAAHDETDNLKYHLTADIERRDRVYFLTALHFPNGGTALFDSNEPLERAKWTLLSDVNRKFWRVRLP